MLRITQASILNVTEMGTTKVEEDTERDIKAFLEASLLQEDTIYLLSVSFIIIQNMSLSKMNRCYRRDQITLIAPAAP